MRMTPQEFKCKQCPSVAYTVGLGLVAFFCSVVLVLFTALTNFADGFGDQADRPAKEGATKYRIEFGDVVKVGVLGCLIPTLNGIRLPKNINAQGLQSYNHRLPRVFAQSDTRAVQTGSRRGPQPAIVAHAVCATLHFMYVRWPYGPPAALL